MKHPDYEKLWKRFSKKQEIFETLDQEKAITFAKMCVIESKKRKKKKQQSEQKEEKKQKDVPLESERMAIFLDRDGVLNVRAKEHEYVRFCSDLKRKMFPLVQENISLLRRKGYLVIIITNQAGINKGKVSESEYNKMIRYLTSMGIDMIYTCPHDYSKEKCKCRKPSSKLIFQASSDWKIDLRKSWMVGDDDVDIESGRRAGCKVFKGTLQDFIDSRNFEVN